MVLHNTYFEFQMTASCCVCMHSNVTFVTFMVTTTISLSDICHIYDHRLPPFHSLKVEYVVNDLSIFTIMLINIFE